MSIDIFIALLLVSTFATVGIVTTLAVWSSRHWFLRTAVVVAMLSPLLVIPATELFVTLLLEAATIAAGLGVVELIRTRAANVRFSLLSLVLCTTLVGLLLAVGRALPQLNRYAWQSLLLMGVGSGLCVLLGHAAVARRPRWYLRLPPIVLVSLLIGLALAWFDWFVRSLQGGVYYSRSTFVDYFLPASIDHEAFATVVWLVTCLLAMAVVALWLKVGGIVGLAPRKTAADRLTGTFSCAAGASVTLLTVVIALPATTVLIMLLTPVDIPSQQLPTPNAYDTIVDISISVHSSPFGAVESNWDTAPPAVLAPAVTAIQDDLNRLSDALGQESQMPIKQPYFCK
jgi:hypothetical protein